MEVEGEREWKATEEEEAAAAPEELGGLQIRQKKKGKIGRKFDEKVANGEDSEDQHSVYLDADAGVWKCRHCTWTYYLSGPGIDLIQKHEGSCQVAMEVETLTQLGTHTHSPIKGADVENGTVDAKESNGHKDVPAEEYNGNLRNAVVENGSNSHLNSDKKSGNVFTRNDNEIQEQAEHTPGESSTFVVEEFDVERVLREQETHDLICPKCRSCITKRVILRKRKRTLSQSGLPPPKAQNVSGTSPLSTEAQDPDDTATVECFDTTVFRCLSCFSFFIPTETGCNILRVFWKRPASDDTQSSENKPARTANWVTSCFGSDSSQNEDTEAEVPLLQETRDPSMGSKEDSPPMSMLGSTNYGENGTPIGKKNAGSSTRVSNSIGGTTGDRAQGDEQRKPAITVSEGPSTGASNSNGVMGNQAEAEKQNNPAPTVSEDVPLLQETRDPSMGSKEDSPLMSMPGSANHGENGTPIGKKNAGSSTGVSNSNCGITGNQAQGDEKKNPAITVSEDPLTGASNSNGVMGNQAEGEKQKNPAPTVSEGNATEKPGFVVKPPSLGGIPHIDGNINNSVPPVTGFLPPGNNIGSSVGVVKPTRPVERTDMNPNIGGSEIAATGDAILDVGVRVPEEYSGDNDWDVLKSIVYGGLIESITSLGVVSSAAGTGSSTLNICALGLANLIGGLFVIAHDISELRSAHIAEAANQRDEQASRYWEKLGHRRHFRRHTFFAILSYIIFGLLPPVVYGFAFRVSDNKEYKLIAVAATSLLCVALLAIGKAHVRPQKNYIVSLFYYLGIALPVAGLSYVAGVMIDRLLVELGLFNPSTVSPSPPSSIDLLKFGSGGSAWASI